MKEVRFSQKKIRTERVVTCFFLPKRVTAHLVATRGIAWGVPRGKSAALEK